MAAEEANMAHETKPSSTFSKQSYEQKPRRRSSHTAEQEGDWPFLSSLLEEDPNSANLASNRSNISTERSQSRSSTTARRLSDRSLGSEKPAERSDLFGYDTFPRSSMKANVARQQNRPIDLFRDDFDSRMEEMVREFDQRCARSLWDDEDRMRGSLFHRSRDESSFMSRSRALNDKFFNRSGIFDDDDDFGFGSNRRKLHGFDDADSGIFSDGTMTSRNRHHTDDSFAIDKVLGQERRCTPEKFEVDIDVKGFKANELLVKTEGNKVIVCAKSKDEANHDLVSRELKREFDLPEGVDPYDVTSSLMPDGFLRVEAPVRLFHVKHEAKSSNTSRIAMFETSSTGRSASRIKSPGI